MKKVFTAQEIMKIIPNRYPICYIDYVDEFIPNQRIVATKNVTINESFFQGHFPGNPVMPGVLIIEALAQAASIMILQSDEYRGKTAYLSGINRARFKKMVRPGDILKLQIEMGKRRGNMGTLTACALVDDKIATEAELFFSVDNES